MFHDIDVCINQNAGFLMALALSSYTDALGGLVNGTITKRDETRKNYLKFLSMMGYSNEECEKYYDKVRCGLTHQYLVKDRSSIGTNIGNTRGIEERNGYICFDFKLYYAELKQAYSNYKEELKTDSTLSAKLKQAISDETVPKDSDVILRPDGSPASTVSPSFHLLTRE